MKIFFDRCLLRPHFDDFEFYLCDKRTFLDYLFLWLEMIEFRWVLLLRLLGIFSDCVVIFIE